MSAPDNHAAAAASAFAAVYRDRARASPSGASTASPCPTEPTSTARLFGSCSFTKPRNDPQNHCGKLQIKEGGEGGGGPRRSSIGRQLLALLFPVFIVRRLS